MINRIVQLSFNPEFTEQFIDIFKQSQGKILSHQGCYHVELLQCTLNPNVFYTRSAWKSENDLNNYRSSELFKSTWSKIKPHFSAPAIAHSTNTIC